MYQKIVKKSAAWSKHGKHQGTLGIAARLNRETARRPGPQMYASIREAMEHRRG